MDEFQFTHPGKGATWTHIESSRSDSSFNSRTLGRVRLLFNRYLCAPTSCFNSRTLGRVRLRAHQAADWLEFVSIHAPWEGCDKVTLPSDEQHVRVSIHAPWEGCDSLLSSYLPALDVSIHAPWEGCDSLTSCSMSWSSTFQFTHPGKGATHDDARAIGNLPLFQFTHPGKGATSGACHPRLG